MAIHIAGVSLPGPSDLLDAVRAVTGWGAEATEVLAELPGRASSVLADVEQLIRRINDVAERADRLVDKVDAVANAASQVAERAGGLLADAGDLSSSAGELLTI
jgi:ABC-type transporter Mla subunit MlaD